jgi:hypothetical protein
VADRASASLLKAAGIASRRQSAERQRHAGASAVHPPPRSVTHSGDDGAHLLDMVGRISRFVVASGSICE